MNKYLLMSAAAVLASTGAATAGTHSWTWGTSGGGSYCDGGTATTGLSSGIADAWIHTKDLCTTGDTSQGSGLLGKVHGLGKIYANSDNYLAKWDGIYTEYLSYNLPKKIQNGATWTLFVGLSGITMYEGNSGTLKNVTAGAHGVTSHGTVGSAAKVRQLIAAHRQ